MLLNLKTNFMDTLREYLKIKAMPAEDRHQYIVSYFNKLTIQDFFETVLQVSEICAAIEQDQEAELSEKLRRLKRENEIRTEAWQKFRSRYLHKDEDNQNDESADKCSAFPLNKKIKKRN